MYIIAEGVYHHAKRVYLRQHINQITKRGLELRAVPVVGVALGVDDALYGIVRRDLCRFEDVLVVHQRARECGGVDVARAMCALADLIVLVVAHFAVRVDRYARLALAVADSGHYHGLCTERAELFAKLGDVCLVVALAVFASGEERRLGDVRNQNISRSAKGLHRLDVVHIEDRIELAVVRHCGVNDADAILGSHSRKDALNVSDLLDAAEVTRVDRAELDIFLLPMRLNRGHIVGEVAEGESAEAARVGGEHGGGKDAGLKSASGEDGERRDKRKKLADGKE